MAILCEDDECFSEQASFDVIQLSPLQETYTKGDELTLTIDIPASNDFFGSQKNIFEESGDNSALVVLADDDIFLENTLNFISGSQGRFPNWFVLPYNAENGTYELEVTVILDRIGQYSHFTGGTIEFGQSRCPDFDLESRFISIEEQTIEFTVSE